MNQRLTSLLALLIASAACIGQERSVTLNEGWNFHQAGSAEWMPAIVPGTVHTDLMRAGMIPDPFVDRNVDSVQWVADRDWVYARKIDVDSALLKEEHVDLVLRGLDTFAEIRLNGLLLGATDNMFRTWEFPIKELLHPGGNDLEITFRSAITRGKELRAAYGTQLPADNDAGEVKVSPYMRKAAYQFGWDFAPRLVTCGIWQSVELRCWSSLRIGEVRISQAFASGDAVVGVEVEVKGASSGEQLIALEIDGQRTVVPLPAVGRKGSAVARASLSIRDPQRWWPNGSGEQVLYPVRVELLDKGRVISAWERKIGLHTISLDQYAGAFTFVVNGEPVFAQGANLVPPDMFLPRAGDSTWVRLVRDMQAAHFNMVRVWGGGVYPPDAFFDACDTAGILIWQDLMFANMAPADSAFLANVKAEVVGQVQRIGHHASLALWCGNNELDVAWKNWGWQKTYAMSATDSARIRADHALLFEKEIRGWITGYSAVPYTPTSPLSNWGNAAGLQSGDLHDWEVWHGDGAFDRFQHNVGRFVSEYGFQSYPDSAMLAKYIDPAQLHLGSPLLAYRQRSYKTDRPILEAIGRELHAEPNTLGEFIRLGQEAQALAYGLAIHAHRAGRPHCMGTLFWQLNDCWPGPSWSAIDFTGHWKPAMLAVQEAYAR